MVYGDGLRRWSTDISTDISPVFSSTALSGDTSILPARIALREWITKKFQYIFISVYLRRRSRKEPEGAGRSRTEPDGAGRSRTEPDGADGADNLRELDLCLIIGIISGCGTGVLG